MADRRRSSLAAQAALIVLQFHGLEDRDAVKNARLVCREWCREIDVAIKSLTLRGIYAYQPTLNGRLQSVTSVRLDGYSSLSDSLLQWLASRRHLQQLKFGYCNELLTLPSLGTCVPSL